MLVFGVLRSVFGDCCLLVVVWGLSLFGYLLLAVVLYVVRCLIFVFSLSSLFAVCCVLVAD